MTDIFQVLFHVSKLIEGDNSRYAQVYVCQSSQKCSVTTLEQNGPWNTRFLHIACMR